MNFKRTELNTGTREVRAGYELDLDRLAKWMNDNVADFSGPLSLEQFKGGQSNPTYKLTTPGSDYVLRRKPSGALLKSAHAVDREYNILSALRDSRVPVPKTYGLCEDDSVIGTMFYVMEFKDGRIFWDLLADGSEPDVRKQLWFSACDSMAELHLVDYSNVGLESLGKDGNYIERQFNRWSRQYDKTRHAVSNPAMEKLIEWIPDFIPQADTNSLIHGDLQFSNMIFHASEPEVIALLDWELSTIGNPLSDLAYFCRVYRLPQEHGGVDTEYIKHGIPSETEIVERYCEKTSTVIDNWEFYLVFAMFRLAAIRQGVAQRVLEGTAASSHAVEVGKSAVPVADCAWEIARNLS